jgi:hypothetical protein
MRMQAGYLVLVLLGLASTEKLQAQYISRGQAVGIIAGIAVAGAGIGIGVTYLILHNRGITTGCVTETGGRKVLTTGSKSYSLIEGGSALAPGERYKLKGQISGSATERTFTVGKIVKNLGSCP